MTQYVFDTLSSGAHLAFNPAVDSLRFTSTADTAASLRLSVSGANLGLTLRNKTIWLDSVAVGQLAVSSLSFANGSYLLAGDGTTDTLADWYGRDFRAGSSAVGQQLWGMGGADYLQGGSGADWLVGNVTMNVSILVSSVNGTGSPTGSYYGPSVSADGRLVAFVGGWTGYGSLNASSPNALVKDLTTGTISIEDRTTQGALGLGGVGSPVISADGRSLVFLYSGSLVTGSSGAFYDIYLAGVGTSAIERVSVGPAGELASDGRNINPDVSRDGRYVVWQSDGSNWAPGGNRDYSDVFLKDRTTGSLTRLSTSLTGGDGNGDSQHARVSADGRYVVFDSFASNLTVNDTNGYADIFVWDRATGGLTNLSNLANPALVRNAFNNSLKPDVAFDNGTGGVIVFETAKALSAQDIYNGTDIYAYFLADNSFRLVSSTAAGAGVQLSSEDARISGDGRFVTFASYSDSLVPNDQNGSRDVFVKDLSTGRIALVSRAESGASGNGASFSPEISLGGEWIVFSSTASNLAVNDGNAGLEDVFRVWNPLLVDTLVGGAGDDTFSFALETNAIDVTQGIRYGGDDQIDGGAGLDVVRYDSARSANTIIPQYAGLSPLSWAQAQGDVVVAGPQGSDTLHLVERAIFNDGAMGLDIEGTGGKAYRLYQAAFDRVPDEGGVGFWIYYMDQGFDIGLVAAAFITSPEFTSLYGPSITNDRFIQLLYQNVLNRDPDAGGYAFWNGAMVNEGGNYGKVWTRSDVLYLYSESAENKANVIGALADGFEYAVYTG